MNWLDISRVVSNSQAINNVAQAIDTIEGDERPFIMATVDCADGTDGANSANINELSKNLGQQLGVDVVDAVFIQGVTAKNMSECVAAVKQGHADGYFGAVGLSGASLEVIAAWKEAEHRCMRSATPFISSLKLWRIRFCPGAPNSRLALMPLARSATVCFMVSGQLTRRLPPMTTAMNCLILNGERLALNCSFVDRIAEAADDFDMTCAELCLGMLLCHEGLSACLVGHRIQIRCVNWQNMVCQLSAMLLKP